MNGPLSGKQRKYLRGIAHGLSPVVLIGAKGLTAEQVRALDDALLTHELIKVKFLEHKDEKKELAAAMASATGAEVAGIIGNIAILYRSHPDSVRRRIVIGTNEGGE